MNNTIFDTFMNELRDNKVVFLFGTGISSALTDKPYSWYKWIVDGIDGLKDKELSNSYRTTLKADDSADNLINMVGKVIDSKRQDGTYDEWMKSSFETNSIINQHLVEILKKLTMFGDIVVTTNYDLLLEKALGMKSLSYEEPNKAFEMIDSGHSDSVVHIHGIYDSNNKMDNIVASQEQYDNVLNDEGAQFIQNLLGTRTVVFIGCGKTGEDANIRKFIEFANKYLKLERTYYYLCKEVDAFDDLPSNVELIRYGNSYSDLPLFLEKVAIDRAKQRLAKNKIIGLSPYVVKQHSNDPLLNYHFSQRNIKFCGRTEELKQLSLFLDEEHAFSWWSITGQAGSGKSRLAYEFLNVLPHSWFGFFLNDNALQSDIDSFVIFSNTLVVIDYVSGREKQIAEVMHGLIDRFKDASYKLRILLLERDNNRTVGSWYSKLLQRCKKSEADILKSSEYQDKFLNLQDLSKEEVVDFISSVCEYHNLSFDSTRDNKLYEIYASKHERLQFRPLYVQLFVEAWINNDFDIPKYDNYTYLIESLLDKEQKKWLILLNDNQSVCNAFVRLLVRSCISNIDINNVPKLYEDDWNVLSSYIESDSFPGKQRGEYQDNLINYLTQNIDDSHQIICPEFPDIIKEYMFSYYIDENSLPDITRELWKDCPSDFSIFVTRCLMDFENCEFYKKALNAYENNTNDIDELLGRLNLLKGRSIAKDEDPSVLLEIIENEYQFWESIVIPDSSNPLYERIALLKIRGLYLVAKQIGSWSLYDVSEMISVIDEMIDIDGGASCRIMQNYYLGETIKELSQKSFIGEAKCFQNKLDYYISKDPNDNLNSLLDMQNYDAKIANSIVYENDFDKAKDLLSDMYKNCKIDDINCVRMLAHSCFIFDYSASMAGQLSVIGHGFSILQIVETLHPDDWEIRARRVGCQASKLIGDYFSDKIDGKELEDELIKLEEKLSTMSFNDSSSDEALSLSYANVKSLFLNIASEQKLNEIICDAREILNEYPKLNDIASLLSMAISKLHKDFLHTKVAHEEVEEIYKYLVCSPDSESLRNNFFDLLEISVDADKKEDYYSSNILREAIQDAKYNPISRSGIADIDDLFDESAKPYIRKYRKIGANEPCPCGSGKKFKKCCRGKGIYD